MGVIITSHRTIIFSLVCATLVSMLFFIAGYMLGKKSAIDPSARIAMIFPAESILTETDEVEENDEQVEKQAEQVAVKQNKSKESVKQGAKTESKDKKREKKENGKKTITKTQPAQPVAKEKKAAKPQPKTQQPNAQKIEQTKKTEAPKVVKSENKQQKTPQAADKTAEPAGQQGIDLTTQIEKPAGARYSIQIEAFGVQRNANRFLDKIKQKYPSAHIFENKAKKRLPLAVRIGYFVSYRRALEAAKVFQAREKRAAMVVKINQ